MMFDASKLDQSSLLKSTRPISDLYTTQQLVLEAQKFDDLVAREPGQGICIRNESTENDGDSTN